MPSEQRSGSPDLDALRPVLTVMSRIQARYVVDLREANYSTSLGLPVWLASAVERGAEAVASEPANPVAAAQHATAFGAALWGALTALPGHSANEHKRLLKAAYAAHARLEAGEDGSGLAAAVRSIESAAARTGTPDEAAGSLADDLASALAAATASAATLDPRLAEEPPKRPPPEH
ncbi:MAG TPA: hypothetical protein VN213_05315 [Solirubrobacteraceae bacterium]|nr:hypothetical protein [Solirubrobacteraceae bacterium]